MHRLKNALTSQFKGATVSLEREVGGRVGGSLVWAGFDGKAQIDRQTQLRRALAKVLSEDDQTKVSFILTLTPNEQTVMASDD